jgi:hypothetical protein
MKRFSTFIFLERFSTAFAQMKIVWQKCVGESGDRKCLQCC